MGGGVILKDLFITLWLNLLIDESRLFQLIKMSL